MMRKLILSALLVMSAAAMAQAQQGQLPQVGAPPQMREVAWMVGTWDVAMRLKLDPTTDTWTETSGTAEYEYINDNSALSMSQQGTFMAMPFHGFGIQTYDRFSNRWQFVWTDNFSARISNFQGSMQGDTMVFQGEDNIQGQRMQARMLTYNVKPTSFSWAMEYSTDNGANWIQGATALYTKRK